MPSIHGHRVLDLLNDSKKTYTITSLLTELNDKFGYEAIYHTCCQQNIPVEELIQFLIEQKKLIIDKDGSITKNSHRICLHD